MSARGVRVRAAAALRVLVTARIVAAARLLAAACVLAAAAASADPASSAQSAWSPLPPRPDSAPAADPLVERGREVFHERCIACHGAIPEQTFGAPFLPPMPGTQALRARYRGEVPAELAERTDLTPALVRSAVRLGLNSMPFFRPTELSDDDLEALIAYLTRARD